MTQINMQWREDAVLAYKGETICAIKENGRRFWAVRMTQVRNPHWRLRHEFSSTNEAMDYIDEQLEGERADGE